MIRRIGLTLLACTVTFMPIAAYALDAPQAVPISGTDAELFSFGWSPDGKVAYALVDKPALRAGYGYLFAIVDTRTDEVLESWYDHSDQFGDESAGTPHAIAWQRNRDQIKANLAAFGIEAGETAAVRPFPLDRGSDRYDVLVSEWRVDPATQPYGNGVLGYTMSFVSRERGSKVIARRSMLFATDVTALGFLESPYENRIAIIVAESGNAYGETRFTDFTIVGAHLIAGFQ